MAAVRAKTARRWCYTVHNDTWQLGGPISQPLSADSPVIYACGQFERAPDTGRIHFQAYAEFSTVQSGRKSATLCGLPATAHHEAARGTPDQCRDYCKKSDTAIPGTFVEVGVWRSESERQGNTKPMAKFWADAKSGKPLHQLLWDEPELYTRAHKTVGILAALAPRPPRPQPRVYFFTGGTGTGKTRTATSCTGISCWISSFTGKTAWFTGYMGQPIAILDDLRDSTFELPFLLRLLDRYPMDVEIKGSTVPWTPHVIIITSNVPLSGWYGHVDGESRAAFDRRITDVWEFHDGGGPQVSRGSREFPDTFTDGKINYIIDLE